MTVNDKHSCYKAEYFPQAIQMQLSKKPKTSLTIFYWISGIYIKFSTFWKKDETQNWGISESMDSGISFCVNVFNTTF